MQRLKILPLLLLAVTAGPAFADPGYDRARALVSEADTALDAGGAEEALALLERADDVVLHEAPNALAWPAMARAYNALGNRQAAFDWLVRAQIAVLVDTGRTSCEGFAESAYLTSYDDASIAFAAERLCSPSFGNPVPASSEVRRYFDETMAVRSILIP